MLYLGILCLIYYIAILIYTRRKDTTFASFWLVFGLLNIVGSFVGEILPKGVAEYLWIPLGLLWCTFVLTEIVIISAFLSLPEEGLGYIIVLGAQVRGTWVTNSLARRLDKALEYLDKNPETRVIVSGGRGKGEEITEAEAMASYLMERGIAKNRIVKEDQSTNTRENLLNSKPFTRNPQKPIGLVTNNFHMYRALQIGKQCGYTKLIGIPAAANPILLPNYMVREFFAVIQIKFLHR
ncbi:MAG: YdcF family protein [Hespellia sp.]|nr:YdcF family protein [Hespellia sp.]